MAKRTQKTGLTARFGSRYGVSVRRRAGSAIKKKSRKYTCPMPISEGSAQGSRNLGVSQV